MIDAIRGQIVSFQEHQIIISSGWIHFSLQMSTMSIDDLRRIHSTDPDGERLIYTYLQHKEDSMTLFGFSNQRERSLFMELITVQGIGPKQALKILSGISTQDFIDALDRNDLAMLTSVPGLGTKTAQKMILALRNRLSALPDPSEVLDKRVAGRSTRPLLVQEVEQALVEMGYDRRLVKEIVEECHTEALEELGSAAEDKRLEETVFRNALIRLG